MCIVKYQRHGTFRPVYCSKCLWGTVAFTWWHRWCRGIFWVFLEYSSVAWSVLAMQLCYCFGCDVTVRFIETLMFQTSGLNTKWCKVKFLTKYLLWLGTNPVFTGYTGNLIYIAFVMIRLKCRWNSWQSGRIQIFAMQWLMGLSPQKYVKAVRLILKRKFHTGPSENSQPEGKGQLRGPNSPRAYS